MKTSEKIIEYVKKNNYATGKQLTDHLEISDRAVRKQLYKLTKNGELSKKGKPPKVYYYLSEKNIAKDQTKEVPARYRDLIEQEFLFITPTGDRMNGVEGFVYWCNKTDQPIAKTAGEYVKTRKKYEKLRENGLINATAKMRSTFDRSALDKVFYLDFYSIERFGKTKLGQMLLYAKQSQSKKLIKELVEQIKPKIEQVITKYEIDGVAFIPPTVKREIQFMKEFERNLNLPQRIVKLTKIKTDIPVPQKTLAKLQDRIENARRTIVVEDTHKYENILLIDDAVGSGATINETANQIKEKGICEGKLIGLAITGSFKGFEVISEV